MKLLAHLFRRFHSAELKTSKQQLLDDFGEFPPKPLRCESLKGELKVIRTHGIGIFYQDFNMLMASANAVHSDPNLLSEEITDNPGFAESMHKSRASLDILISAGFPPSICKAIFSIFHPLACMYLIASGKNRPTRPGILGYFNPRFKNELQIVVKSRRIRELKRREDSIISHEHLHLLQNRNPEVHRKYANNSQDLLNDDVLSDPPLLKNLQYVMEKFEVEARLHECVLSFYRTHGHLPITISGFLGLLASSRDCGELYSLVLKLRNIELKKQKLPGITIEKFEEYSDRDSEFTKELLCIINFTKTHDLQYRFITEVLTVMYGNLLKYYGDHETSKIYLQSIARPNFYDELYSVEPTLSSSNIGSSVQRVQQTN